MPSLRPKIVCATIVLAFVIITLATFEACAGLGRNGPDPGPPPTNPPQSITTPPAPAVLTYHNDNGRTGLNSNETALTPVNVNVSQFGKVFSFPVDGLVAAQPLYLQGVNILGQGTFNVVFVATEHDSVYAFDADGKTNDALWKTSFINPAAGINTVSTNSIGGSTIYPEIGITGTPVIDPNSNTLYVEVLTNENGTYIQRLHALDVTSGKEKFGGPVRITASVPGNGSDSSGGTVTFNSMRELQRSALLLANGKIYIAFASHADHTPYHGWVLAYDATTLQPAGAWNDTPDGDMGGIWMSGCGLSVDSAGVIYGISGNGNFNAASGGRDYGSSFFKLAPDLSSVQDYFTPANQNYFSSFDVDVGSAGALLVPDQQGAHPHLLISGDKAGTIYVIDRDNMGHYSAGGDSEVLQTIANALGTGALDRNFSTPAYWNSFVYFIGGFDKLKAFQISNGLLTTVPTFTSSNAYGEQGATAVISANGNSNAIMWALDNWPHAPALHAYDATDVSKELYSSSQNAGRDGLSGLAHFAVPTVANGRVYVGTKSALVVYGLLKN